ncbi:MAG TPA: hypothetical protein VNS81_03830 [Nocardioides sp.]|nr:hypothetical protein [Nocardioides sp.]
MSDEGRGKPERFASGGRGTGVVGLVVDAVLLVYGVVEPRADYAAWAWPALLLAGVVIWVVLVRPAVVVRGDLLELRNLVRSTWLPLARATRVEIAQMTTVHTAEGKHVGVGLSRSRRQVGQDLRLGDLAPRTKTKSLGGMVEEKLNRGAARAREDQARLGTEPPAVRHTWAWPEIAALVVLTVATVVLALA